VPAEEAAGSPGHVLVVRTLDRPRPASWSKRRRGGVSPSGAWLTEVTVIDSRESVSAERAAGWLASAGAPEVTDALTVLNRALRAHRLATADELAGPLDRRQALTARLGYGTGEELAAGQLAAARELPWEPAARPRRRMIEPEARLAALLSGREHPLLAEELALRARLDLNLSFSRAAALQTMIALDAAIAEVALPPQQLDGLRRDREPVAAAAQAALGGEPTPEQMGAVVAALERIEAPLSSSARS
jgi:hypothetical protein